MEIKNTKVDLFGTTVTIQIMDVVKNDDGDDIYGKYNMNTKNIYVARYINGEKLKDSEIKITILHELVHAIFNIGQYKHSCDDEPLVEWTARCLFKLINKKVL